MLCCNEKKPYVFVSYAHKDMERVTVVINQMVQNGYNVWFDEGIDPGTEWDEMIAQHINNCSYFIAFISKNYIDSKNCKDELNYSRDLDKPQFLVYLEDVELPSGMAMRMNRIQSVFLHKYEDVEEAHQKIFSAAGLDVAKISDGAPKGFKPYGARFSGHLPAADVAEAGQGSVGTGQDNVIGGTGFTGTEATAGAPVTLGSVQGETTPTAEGTEKASKKPFPVPMWMIAAAGAAVIVVILVVILALKGCNGATDVEEGQKRKPTKAAEITDALGEPTAEPTPEATPTTEPEPTKEVTPTMTPEPTKKPGEEVFREYEPEDGGVLLDFPIWRPEEGEKYTADCVAYSARIATWGGEKRIIQAGTSIGDVDDSNLRARVIAYSVGDLSANGIRELEFVVQIEKNQKHADTAQFVFLTVNRDGKVIFSADTLFVYDEDELLVGEFYKGSVQIPEVADGVIFMRMTEDDRESYENYYYLNMIRHQYWPKEYMLEAGEDRKILFQSDGTMCAEDEDVQVTCHIAAVKLTTDEQGQSVVEIVFQPEFDSVEDREDTSELEFVVNGYDETNQLVEEHVFSHSIWDLDTSDEEDEYGELFEYEETGFYTVRFVISEEEVLLIPKNQDAMDED